MESQLEGQTPLRATLEEKKTQLHNYKALQQDVMSYQRVIESINDKVLHSDMFDRIVILGIISTPYCNKIETTSKQF